MRIGIMLRAYDRPGGIGIYCRNIVKHLVKDCENHYVLMYNNPAHLGTYNHLDHVEELYLPGKNPLIWDQVSVPSAAKKARIDLLFNTKFSLPFRGSEKKIMVLHGASWFVRPDLYTKLDIMYVKMMMPVYCRMADFLVSNSDLTTNDFIRIVKVPEDKIETVRLAQGDSFITIDNRVELEAIRKKYSFPQQFFLTVTSYDPRKNFSSLLDAFEQCRKNHPDIHLLVVGKNCHKYSDDYQIEGRGLKEFVHFPGWIEQDDLPAIYNLARAFVFPSVYEEFGIPVVEAMACGCPIISSSTGAIPELTQGAALLSDPYDIAAITGSMEQILGDPGLGQQLREKGLQRAKDFSWSRAAAATLAIFKQVAKSATS